MFSFLILYLTSLSASSIVAVLWIEEGRESFIGLLKRVVSNHRISVLLNGDQLKFMKLFADKMHYVTTPNYGIVLYECVNYWTKVCPDSSPA